MKDGFRKLGWLWFGITLFLTIVINGGLGLLSIYFWFTGITPLWSNVAVIQSGIAFMWILFGLVPSGIIFCFTGMHKAIE